MGGGPDGGTHPLTCENASAMRSHASAVSGKRQEPRDGSPEAWATCVPQHAQVGLDTRTLGLQLRPPPPHAWRKYTTGSGASFANRLNGSFFLIADGPTRTVFDDGAIDVLSGSSGRDWFFAKLGSDEYPDQESSGKRMEILTELL